MLLLRIAFASLFLLGAYVQLNDPDPWRWVAIYVAAAAVVAGGRRAGQVAGSVAVVAMVWAAVIASSGMPPMDWAALVGDAVMKTEGVEKWRELLGLGVIAGACLVSAWAARRAPPATGSSANPTPPR